MVGPWCEPVYARGVTAESRASHQARSATALPVEVRDRRLQRRAACGGAAQRGRSIARASAAGSSGAHEPGCRARARAGRRPRTRPPGRRRRAPRARSVGMPSVRPSAVIRDGTTTTLGLAQQLVARARCRPRRGTSTRSRRGRRARGLERGALGPSPAITRRAGARTWASASIATSTPLIGTSRATTTIVGGVGRRACERANRARSMPIGWTDRGRRASARAAAPRRARSRAARR